jgi:membrane-associated protein
MDFSVVLAIFQDLPGHLTAWTQSMGPWIYVLLFAIIFAETGLIVTPFLPGDSLLFAVGALTAVEGGLSLWVCVVLLIIAAILGDAVNYSVGRWLGAKAFRNPNSKVFNPAHLEKTQAFYLKHGGKTIILARFVPIIRTYAPFVAGMGRMEYAKFASFNVVGAIAWIGLFTVGGHLFGNLESVKRNFHIVILAILVLSVLPVVIEVLKARRSPKS